MTDMPAWHHAIRDVYTGLFSRFSFRRVSIRFFNLAHLAWHIGQDHMRSTRNLLKGLNELRVFEFVKRTPKLPVLLVRLIWQSGQGFDHVACEIETELILWIGNPA